MKQLIKTKVFNTAVAFAAAVVLLLFLWSYLETGSPPTLISSQTGEVNPSYYLINAKSTQFNKQGALDMTMKSDKIEHDPKNASARLRHPRIALYGDGVLTWTVRANTGIAYELDSRIDLKQRVIIASGDNQTVVKTPYLELYPDEKRAQTDKPVNMRSPTGFTRSIGLKANMQTQHVQLLDQVRGQYNAIP